MASAHNMMYPPTTQNQPQGPQGNAQVNETELLKGSSNNELLCYKYRLYGSYLLLYVRYCLSGRRLLLLNLLVCMFVGLAVYDFRNTGERHAVDWHKAGMKL